MQYDLGCSAVYHVFTQPYIPILWYIVHIYVRMSCMEMEMC